MNYDILELVLSYVYNFRKLVMLSRVSKNWMILIRESNVVWENVYVNITARINQPFQLISIVFDLKTI
jgi:hypothetical protein